MSLKLGPITDDIIAELKASEARWRAFFKRYGYEFPEAEMMNHPANIAFTTVVEKEHAAGRQVDFPLARQMFMLGYMRGHDAFPMRKDCKLFAEDT